MPEELLIVFGGDSIEFLLGFIESVLPHLGSELPRYLSQSVRALENHIDRGRALWCLVGLLCNGVYEG